MESQEVVQVDRFGDPFARLHHGTHQHQLGYPRSQHHVPLQHHQQSVQEILVELGHAVEVDVEECHVCAVCGCRPSQSQHHLHPTHQLTSC